MKSLRILHFRHAGWRPMDGVYWGRQACTSFPLGKPGHREADPAAVQLDFAENCVAANASVRQCGGNGVWVGRSCRNDTLRHLPYTGVSLGWMWWNPKSRPEPRATPARENRIAFNRISHVMQTLSDGGGIYTLGGKAGRKK